MSVRKVILVYALLSPCSRMEIFMTFNTHCAVKKKTRSRHAFTKELVNVTFFFLNLHEEFMLHVYTYLYLLA